MSTEHLDYYAFPPTPQLPLADPWYRVRTAPAAVPTGLAHPLPTVSCLHAPSVLMRWRASVIPWRARFAATPWGRWALLLGLTVFEAVLVWGWWCDWWGVW